jgi:hypothetical protein
LSEILICEFLVQEFVDVHHQIQRQSCLSLHELHRHNIHFGKKELNTCSELKLKSELSLEDLIDSTSSSLLVEEFPLSVIPAPHPRSPLPDLEC